jgi:hypothetical protein
LERQEEIAWEIVPNDKDRDDEDRRETTKKTWNKKIRGRRIPVEEDHREGDRIRSI